jgi:hypothetical protein
MNMFRRYKEVKASRKTTIYEENPLGSAATDPKGMVTIPEGHHGVRSNPSKNYVISTVLYFPIRSLQKIKRNILEGMTCLKRNQRSRYLKVIS